MKLPISKPGDTILKAAMAIGALNWATAEFVNIDVLTYVPGGIVKSVVVGIIGIAGVYGLTLLYKKKL